MKLALVQTIWTTDSEFLYLVRTGDSFEDLRKDKGTVQYNVADLPTKAGGYDIVELQPLHVVEPEYLIQLSHAWDDS